MTNTVIDRDATITSAEFVARAQALQPMIREDAAEAEQLGHYTPRVHEALLEAGLYHLLTPKKYGGYEADVTTFIKVVLAIAEGDPGTGWCYSLGHAHNMIIAANWPERAQDEIFNNPLGYFRASHSMQPAGTATKVDGGYLINAKSGYQSGVPYSSHAMVYVQLTDHDGDKPLYVNAVVPAGSFTILDDWGAGSVLGLRASGSNTVVVDNVVVPEDFVQVSRNVEGPEDVPGVAIHGSSLYYEVPLPFQAACTTTNVLGAAKAALAEYDRHARMRKSGHPPFLPRTHDDIYQRDFYLAKMKVDAAEVCMVHAMDTYSEKCELAVAEGVPFTLKESVELGAMVTQAGHFAAEAVDILWSSIGASTARSGELFERLVRDTSMYRVHNYNNLSAMARNFGAIHFDAAESYNPN